MMTKQAIKEWKNEALQPTGALTWRDVNVRIVVLIAEVERLQRLKERPGVEER